jgi:photosystem I P700 chlorophyll a apoprotein A1
MYFHGARFSNYEAWLRPNTSPSACCLAIVGQEILNGDVGGGFQGIQITSGFFNYGAQVVLQANFNFTQLRLAV